MNEVHLKVELVPGDDPQFHAAVDAGIALVRQRGLQLGSPIAAGIAEEHVRAAGFSQATVTWNEAPGDTLGLQAEWTVRRDG